MTLSPSRELRKSSEALRQTGWLQAANYEFTHRLARRGWAWEFLRRNKNYAADWAFTRNEPGVASQDNRLGRFILDAGVSLMQRWGLIFRRRTGSERHQC